MLTLWCIMRSPLMIGGDMTGFDTFTMSLLNNPELIEVLQHTHSAHPLFRKKTEETETCAWMTTYENGDFCVALFNLGETETEVTAVLPFGTEYTCYDIWNKTEFTVTDGCISKPLPKHGAAMYRVAKR